MISWHFVKTKIINPLFSDHIPTEAVLAAWRQRLQRHKGRTERTFLDRLNNVGLLLLTMIIPWSSTILVRAPLVPGTLTIFSRTRYQDLLTSPHCVTDPFYQHQPLTWQRDRRHKSPWWRTSRPGRARTSPAPSSRQQATNTRNISWYFSDSESPPERWRPQRHRGLPSALSVSPRGTWGRGRAVSWGPISQSEASTKPGWPITARPRTCQPAWSTSARQRSSWCYSPLKM